MLIVGCLSDLDKNEAHYRGKVQNINWQQLFSVRILRHKMRAILRKMLTHRYCLPVYFMPARKLLACRMLTSMQRIDLLILNVRQKAANHFIYVLCICVFVFVYIKENPKLTLLYLNKV